MQGDQIGQPPSHKCGRTATAEPLLAQLVVLLAELINLNNCKVIRIEQETAEATPWPLRAAATE